MKVTSYKFQASKKESYLFAFILFCLLAVLFVPYFVIHASVVLNEVAIQPNQAVELYNTASTSADISGWYLDDAGGTTYYTIPQQTILPPQSCFVFSSDFNFNKSSSDVIRLFDSSNSPTTSSAKLLESYSYTKAPDAGYSFVKIIDGGTDWQTNTSSLGLLNESLVSCIPTLTPTPTPTETPSPTPTTYNLQPTTYLSPTTLPSDYSNIFISEVFPYPQTNENEWIELYNNNNFKVCLEKWYIDDGENAGSTPKQISLCLESYSYGAADITSSLFNNSGDSARLLNAEKTEKDSIEYGKIVQGKSIGRISFENDEYCEQEPSKNAPNTDCIVQIAPTAKSSSSAKTNPSPTKNGPSPTKKQTLATSQIAQINGDVLGVKSGATNPYPITPIPYLSSVSFSYSLLTIVSVFIKMKNA
jgi:hypothetical protein